MFDFTVSAWTVVKLWIVAGSLWGWLHIARCCRGERPILVFVTRRRVPWGVVEIGAMVLTVFALQMLAFSLLKQFIPAELPDDTATWPLDYQALALGSFSLATLVALLFGIWLARSRTGATGRDLGLRPWQPLRDAGLGLAAFATLFFPVFFLQFVLTQFFETRHPLIELLRSSPSPLFLVMSGVSAVLIAPVVEEYFFRVFLQGWLENLAAHFQEGGETAGAKFRAVVLGRTVTGQPAPRVPDAGSSWEAPALADDLASDPREAILRDGLRRPSWGPILVSSLLFALAHYDHGPDPIPLFVLACGLGYLYQRTHRVVPCIAVHGFVNLFTMIELTFYLHGPATQ